MDCDQNSFLLVENLENENLVHVMLITRPGSEIYIECMNRQL